MAAIDINTETATPLARMCELLEAEVVTVRTVQVTYHSIPFFVTYNLLHLTRFAYHNPDPTNPASHLAKYIAASVTTWSLLGNDGVTPLPVSFASLAQLEPTLVTAIGRALSNDYAAVTSAVCRSYTAVVTT